MEQVTSTNITKARISFGQRFFLYFKSMKPLQTALLLFTSIMAYLASTSAFNWSIFLLLIFSVFMAVGGTTILNMVYDRDIDAMMKRTKKRALPQGMLGTIEATIIGFIIMLIGITSAVYINYVTAIVIAMGSFLDLVVYTLILKRKHRYSIIFGGLAGGMPALAGRTAAINRIDLIGLLLVIFIAAWVPIHILTLAINYKDDYAKAGVPMWPVQVGVSMTLRTIAIASIVSPLSIMFTYYLIGINQIVFILMLIPSVIMAYLCILNLKKPELKRNWVIFKLASMYMTLAFLLLPFH